MAAAYFTFINAQICSLISYLCVGILCNLYEMCNKTCPVDRCWSIFLKSRNMFCRAIPFIRCKTIFRHSLVIFHHQTVSRNFCYNTCSRNRCALGTPLNDRHLRILIPGIVTASFRRSCGITASLLTACGIAS